MKKLNIIRIRELRENNNYNQAYIASVLSTTQQQYSKYEIGSRLIPIDKLVKLADFYNVSIDYILDRTNKKEINK